ncbi:MAG: serine/threonine protein kinase [Deltaproteobacteria bacterium]|nr:MAG: serine/threonine protein kinase [Deltaproteobacteria bacterium]
MSQPTEVFGPYEVYECLGKGGMATVHRAVRRGIEGFERVDALKRLLPHLEIDAGFVRAFVREAKLAARLSHGNIVQIHDLGKVGDRYFIAMEYLPGRNLVHVLRQARAVAHPAPVAAALCIVGEMLDALGYAHAQVDHRTGAPLNLVHADVSPSNVIVSDEGHAKVIDFGIARAASAAGARRRQLVAGKLGYMAPEVMAGEGIDARADVFAVGAIAYELLTAQPLLPRDSAAAARAALDAGIAPPSAAGAACSPAIDEIVMTALAVDPAQRFSSAGAMRDAIDQTLHEMGVAATRRAVAEWLATAFALDPVRRRAATAGGRARTFPLQPTPDDDPDHRAVGTPAGGRAATAPPLAAGTGAADPADDEPTGERAADRDLPALVTESVELSDAVRAKRSRSPAGATPEEPAAPRRRAPRISSPPVPPDLMPRITFRTPSDSPDE